MSFLDTRPNADVGAGRFQLRVPEGVAISPTFSGFALGGQAF